MQRAGAREIMAFLDVRRSPSTSDTLALIEMIRDGLSLEVVEEAAKALDLTTKDLTTFGVIAARTFSHSKRHGKLSQVQSDRFTRFLRLFQMATDTFGSPNKGIDWLNRSTRALDGQTPMGLLDTEAGARLVETLLTRIDHGIAA